MIIRCLSILVSFLALPPGAGTAAIVTAEEVVRTVEERLAPQNFRATYRFTNTRLDKTTTVYEVAFSTRDSDHSHGAFSKPEREKGREILRLSDALWTFLPGVGRVVRIADRDSFAGGDFSNADVLRVDWLSKYKPSMLKELPSQWIIELTATSNEAPYARMRLWVDRKTTQPVQQQFFDSQGTLLKTCLYGSIKSYGTLSRPSHLLMENLITKQHSELEILALELVPSLPDRRFAIDSLGK